MMIGATGPQMMEMTGEIADGVVLNYCVPPDYNHEAMEQLARAPKTRAAPWMTSTAPSLIVCSVHDDRQTALDGARELLDPIPGPTAPYCQSQRRQTRSRGADPGDPRLAGDRRTGAQAMHLVPDDLVQRITASGTPAEVKAKVREYVNNGATCPILYPLGDVKLMIDTFADGY